MLGDDPYSSASLFSKSTLGYAKEAMSSIYSSTCPEDIKRVSLNNRSYSRDSSSLLAILRFFERFVPPRYNLMISSFVFMIPHILLIFILTAVNSSFSYYIPQLQHAFLKWGFDVNSSSAYGFVLALSILLTQTLQQWYQNLTNPLRSFSGRRVEYAFAGLGLRKRFRLHPDIIANVNSIDLRNISERDIYSVATFVNNLVTISMLPMNVMTCIVTVRKIFTGTVRWAIIAAFVTIPLPSLFQPDKAKDFEEMFQTQGRHTQETRGLITNIKSIKVNGWEDAIKKKILTILDSRSSQEKRFVLQSSLATTLAFLQKGIVMTTLFVENTLANTPIDALSIAPTLALVEQFKVLVMSCFERLFSLKQCFNGVKLFQSYLNASEVENYAEVDGQRHTVLGQTWRGMSAAEKKAAIAAIDETVAVDFKECLLGYRLRVTTPQEDTQPTSKPANPYSFSEISKRVWDLVKKVLVRIRNLFLEQDVTPTADPSILYLSSLSFVPLSARTTRSLSPSPSSPHATSSSPLSVHLSVPSTSSPAIPLPPFSLTLEAHKHYSLIGPVGCGKSLLLSTMAGQSDLYEGWGFVRGRSILLPQNTLILDSTIKANVLFGLDYNKELFDQVIHACCLVDDLKAMPKGIETVVGNRGQQLSGGQKARVCLARLCYTVLVDRQPVPDDSSCGPRQPPSILLLDDPTSACDMKVTRWIERHVLDGILRNETVVMATHNKPLAFRFGQVLEMKDGIITPLNENGFEFGSSQSFAVSSRFNMSDGDLDDVSDDNEAPADGRSDESSPNEDVKLRVMNPTAVIPTVAGPTSSPSASETTPATIPTDDSSATETKKKGAFRWLNKSTLQFLLGQFSFVLFVVSTVCSFTADWLTIKQRALTEEGEFVQTATSHSADSPVPTRLFTSHSIGLYFWYSIVITLIRFVHGYLNNTITAQNRRSLTTSLLNVFLDAPLHVFQTADKGHLEELFVFDVFAVSDPRLNPLFSFIGALQLSLVEAVALFVKMPDFQPLFILLVFLSFLVTRLSDKYKSEAHRRKQLSRARNRSYTKIQVLSCATTIHQMGREDAFFNIVALHEDEREAEAFYENQYYRWVRQISNTLEHSLPLLLWFFALKAKRSTGQGVSLQFVQSSASVALALYSRVKFVFTSMDEGMDAVDRVQEGLQTPQENGHLRGEKEAASKTLEWTKSGSVEVEDLQVKYTPDGKSVLTDVGFKIEDGQWVGVVGRTGCGKSTLTLSLLNLMIREKGTIRIGGKNIDEINTNTLRQHIAVVQQDVALVAGTIRDNIDPHNAFSDEAVLNALSRIGIREVIEALPQSLQTPLSDSTSVLSAGQRQLLSVACALLRQTKLVLLDEPSSNVDQDTDGVLQQVMREAWRDATVIVVAHRLTTIADSDVTIVMDAGRVVEAGKTVALLHTPGSALQKLALSSGPNFLEQLQAIALAAQSQT
ncbi:Multidrug resistance-associated protein [Blattamonas nauphoetae]|uniref:Multidrug resistance-associated protein n=1 Tax=Blattamonas nauphoetae TaxID=2049346 RepID=A0ABQ9X764_9EUKA|nr:Multidrug resistance-associated protein [Blattamonas nauphoetae]